jgi:hypothetical protein
MKRRLTTEQAERLIAGAPFADGGELDELATFMRALPAAVSGVPDATLSTALVPRLAEAARRSAAEKEARPATTAVIGARRPLTRRALVARVAVAVALIPACMAGLAFAGVTVPEPARQAFDDVGVTLPNQPSDEASTPASESGGNEGGASETAPNGKAKAKGKNGQPGSNGRHRGKALGKGKSKGHGNGNAGGSQGNSGNAPGHTGANGSSQGKGGGSSGKTPPGKATKQAAPVSHGKAKGHSK